MKLLTSWKIEWYTNFFLYFKDIFCLSMSKFFLRIFIFQVFFVSCCSLKASALKETWKILQLNYSILSPLFCCRQCNVLMQWFESQKNRLKMLKYESLFFFCHLSGLYRYIVFAIWCWSSKSLTLKLLDRNSELWKIEKVGFLTRGCNKRKVFSPLEQSTNKRKKLRQSNYKLVDHVVFRWFVSKRSQNAPIDDAWMKTKVVWFAKELVFNEFQWVPIFRWVGLSMERKVRHIFYKSVSLL